MNPSDRISWALAVCLAALCGCSHLRGRRDRYELIVKFLSPEVGEIQRVEITVVPGRPFAVRTKDQAGNRYEVSGTLRCEPGERFKFDPWKTELQLASGGGVRSEGRPQFMLGQDIGAMGIHWYGESI